MSMLKDKVLQGSEFIITCEFVPGRGSKGQAIDEALNFGQKVVSSGLPIHAVSITDNPGGNPAIGPDTLATELANINIESLVHFSCAGINRNSIESRASGLARKGLQNLLVVTGDYPVGGYGGRAKPVFDLDSVQAVHYLKYMNTGIEIPGKSKDSPARLTPTEFFIACGVSPFGKNEAELIPQLIKLEKKIQAGADFIIPQLGYDVRKFGEILKYLKYRGLNVPVFGNCYVLSRAVAKVMNRGDVPGAVVTEELVKVLETEAGGPDKGKGARLERAAQLTAVFKGMGMRGVHIGGFNLKFEDFEYVIKRSQELTANWHDFVSRLSFGSKNDFYLFPEDPDLTFAEDKLDPVRIPTQKCRSLHCFISRCTHRLVFTPATKGFVLGKYLCSLIKKNQVLLKTTYGFEHLIKNVLYNCKECGDCALFNIAYLCPMDRCAKFQRNGPYGGGRNGMCEANPNKECIWAMAYKRLSSSGSFDSLREYVPPVNYSLAGTSSWTNYFDGTDHTSAGNKILTG